MAIEMATMQHNLGLEADILEECAAYLNQPINQDNISVITLVQKRLERMATRMREREKGERA